MSVGRFLQQGAAGNAGGAVYVDDVFSTYLYTGNGSAQTITNGIDLDGEGGLVWTKARVSTSGGNTSHALIDTERGSNKWLSTNSSSVEATNANLITSFNSDGYSVGTGGPYWTNDNGYDYVSWTFRKQPGFFDVVTYTGNGLNPHVINHNLGATPGMIIQKAVSRVGNWTVWHRSLATNHNMFLNSTSASSAGGYLHSVTDSSFTVNSDSELNQAGQTYIAYIFAHDAQDFGTDSDESIIKCGSFTGPTATINLGFEPQWLLIKPSSTTANWAIYDVMRGQSVGGTAQELYPNLSNAEGSGGLFGTVNPEPTGFSVTGGYSASHIYVAIRRPHKPASEFAATDLFSPNATASATGTEVSTNFPIDMQIINLRSVVDFRNGSVNDRLRGVSSTSTETANYLITNSASAESTSGSNQTRYWDNTGFQIPSFISTNSTIFWNFRRAPGFFDVVAYTGNSTVRTINHNLGVTPKLAISKSRDDATNWWVYAEFLGDTNYLRLNLTSAVGSAGSNYLWGSTWTDTLFSVGAYSGINFSGYDYICYLFGDVSGISKVGSYTGTGANVDVNCGFTSGARFVLVKRTDSTGDWYLWDSVRGIVAGNDPYLLLNSTAAQVTSTDYIDPLSSGFTITSSAPAALNASGGTYIFLAIA